MFITKTAAAVALLAALSPFAALAHGQDTNQKHGMAILVGPPPAAPHPGRSASPTLTMETVNPTPQNPPQNDLQTAAAKP